MYRQSLEKKGGEKVFVPYGVKRSASKLYVAKTLEAKAQCYHYSNPFVFFLYSIYNQTDTVITEMQTKKK